ncbi:hypothetical protein [Spirosoma sp. 48-14]|uniref:hypothetical protein n=1 Tax=Spirosoma sp. 48-14 TaxID=1895854 RepID=UPI0009664CFF|nr:hypothetical protein [Spirosoma sp. 48-14]OJW76298.1 MAG: hypothetical protein BGO59_22530 [Spirosoma sp. 48-14]
MAPRKRKRLRTIWTDFVYGALHNPRTTITALGVAIPILYKAIEQHDWHLALTGIGTFLGGLFASDARKETHHE